MPEPTDHRAEAVGRLRTAAILSDAPAGGSATREAAIAEALIGIGHALLAKLQPIPDGRAGERCNHSHSTAVCGLLGGHAGDHTIRWSAG